MRSAWLRRPALLASLTIIAVVVVANAILIFGFASADPMLYFSGLGRPTQGVVDGSWTIDPNVGWTVQALGQRSVDSWLNGNVPLWNNYEGLGQPLAGEMQSAAFFLPFVLLQALPGGVLLMHLCWSWWRASACCCSCAACGWGGSPPPPVRVCSRSTVRSR